MLVGSGARLDTRTKAWRAGNGSGLSGLSVHMAGLGPNTASSYNNRVQVDNR